MTEFKQALLKNRFHTPTIEDVLSDSHPDVNWQTIGDPIYENVTFFDDEGNEVPNLVSEEVLNSELTDLIAEWQNYDYARNRVYPSIGDQLDDLFKAGAFSEEMTALIQAVKDAHPKPAE